MAELFDLQEEAQKRKKEGMEEAARNRKRLLEVARDCAEEMSCYGEKQAHLVLGVHGRVRLMQQQKLRKR